MSAAEARVLRPRGPEWPERLSEIHPQPPPARLFAIGRPLRPDAPAVAVVGTRRPTGAGVQVASTLASGLTKLGVVVVSGMAVGIDAVAHEAALRAGGHTVAVLGCGLDVRYPRRNLALKRNLERDGTIVTEYEAGTPPLKQHFPLRNRIISGLSLGVVVVEGAITSGALVTARLALDANRTVYAVPGSVRNPMSEGPNELIRRGEAALVTDVSHIIEDLLPSLLPPRRAQRAPSIDLDESEAAVVRALDDTPIAPDHIGIRSGIPPARLTAILSNLEMRGIVTRAGGGYARGDPDRGG